MPARDSELDLPTSLRQGLAAQGWEYRVANEAFVFLQRPGYWLRLSPEDAHTWVALVTPEDGHVPDGVTWPPPAFEPHELVPAVTGRGARTKALEEARRLWSMHEPYLAELGIKLWGVGVRQNTASGGSGSSVHLRTYFRPDVFPSTDPS